ncbi:MAG: polysaccharide pyruvyl transferase CsaB [bacterium]
MRRILLAGYFGMGNLGDEAILEAEITYLRDKFPNVEISVLSGNPDETSKRFHCPSYNRRKLKEISRAISLCDLFLLGGGGLFQDITSFQSLIYYLLLVQLARLKKKKVAIFSVGIGPLKRSISEDLVVRVIRKVEHLSLRDRESFNWALSKGITKAVLSADASLLLSPSPQGERRKEIGVALRSWKGLKLEEIKEFLVEISKKGYELSFIIFNPKDRTLSQSLAEEIGGKIHEPKSPREAIELLAGMEAAIAMRLHCAILSTIAGTPFLALSYDPKVQSFAEEVGQPFLPLENLNKEALMNLFEKRNKENLEEALLSLRGRVERAIEMMRGLIESS